MINNIINESIEKKRDLNSVDSIEKSEIESFSETNKKLFVKVKVFLSDLENKLNEVLINAESTEQKKEIENLKIEAEKITESTLSKISEQMGSNRGGWYEDSNSKQKFYVKFYKNFHQARVEYIANLIYSKIGVKAVKSELKVVNGEEAITSLEIPGAKGVYRDEIKNNTDVRSGFIADAYLANWDVTGANYDNIVQGEDGGMYRIDNGGSLIFRAKNGEKDYPPDDVPELKNMLNPNYPSGRVFGNLTEEEMCQQAQVLIENLSEEDIDRIVEKAGFVSEITEKIRLSLKGRRQFLIKRFDLKSEKDMASISTKFQEGPKNGVREFLEKDPNVEIVLENPKIQSYMSINYELPDYDGYELKKGKRLAFVVPKEFRNRVVRDVILRHRKGEKYRVNIGTDGWDPNGAYSRLELHNTETNQWQPWKDPKGRNTDKFAEPRSAGSPEHEILHDWVATVGEIKPDAIRITSVGESEKYSTIQIHGVELVFFPETKKVEYKEQVYCSGTEFIDLEKGKTLPKYGGGSHTEGKYIGAIPLNINKEVLFELGKNPGSDAEIKDNKIYIKLEPNRELVQLEVAVGDTEHLKEISPKTHRKTRLGYAKLWAGIKRANGGRVEWFMENINVPPQGVFAGGPLLENSKIQEGDKLVIESRADTAYLMAWRIAYKEKGVDI